MSATDLTSLTPRVQEWRVDGEFLEVFGDQIFVRRREGLGPLVLFLHGFPSSSYDWRLTLGLLGQARDARL